MLKLQFGHLDLVGEGRADDDSGNDQDERDDDDHNFCNSETFFVDVTLSIGRFLRY